MCRIPGAGSYPNIESRESPVGGSCNYVNETSGTTANAAVAAAVAAASQATVSSEPKLIYKKSVFKKKSTSSTATVSRFYFYFWYWIYLKTGVECNWALFPNLE